MMSARVPPSSRAFSSSTLMKLTGYSGGAAGAAPRSRMAAARPGISARRSLASRDAGPAAHGGPAVAELPGLHRLPLAAIRDRVDPEVGARGVHVHQVVAGV